MFRLPVELFLAVFSYLDFYQLLRVRQVCRRWQEIIFDSHLWPSSVHGRFWPEHIAGCDSETYPPRDVWSIRRPNWAAWVKSDPQKICQVLQMFSNGRTKSLCVDCHTGGIDLQDILVVLHNFLFLEELSIEIDSISSHELTSVLQGLHQLSAFRLRACGFQDTPTGCLKSIQLNLRTLHIEIRARGTTILHNILANIVENSPGLAFLVVVKPPARKEWTTKLGDRIEHLRLCIEGTIPPISCKGLKCLVLEASRDQSRELLEPCACDLSYLSRLTIYDLSAEQQLSLMEAYNIGENLEFMYMNSSPGYAALSRTPKLKILSLYRLGIDMPLHVCPALRYVCQYIYLDSNLERDERKRLQSQGYIVMDSVAFYDETNRFICDQPIHL
jgi:hypothetical protein